MLKLYIGYPHHISKFDIINRPSGYVTTELVDSDILTTDIGVRMLKECSAISKIINSHSFVTNDGYEIGIADISGGVKALLVMLTSDLWVNMSHCGDNCNKFVAEISRMKDLNIFTTRFYDPFEMADLDSFLLLNNNVVYNNSLEYLNDKRIYDYYDKIGE